MKKPLDKVAYAYLLFFWILSFFFSFLGKSLFFLWKVQKQGKIRKSLLPWNTDSLYQRLLSAKFEWNCPSIVVLEKQISTSQHWNFTTSISLLSPLWLGQGPLFEETNSLLLFVPSLVETDFSGSGEELRWKCENFTDTNKRPKKPSLLSFGSGKLIIT